MVPHTSIPIAFRCLGDKLPTPFRWCWLLLFLLVVCGCGKNSPSHWHAKFDWKADEYFDDPQVIQLCQAIEANDLAEMERLIQAGANVNAQGKGNMTPLLWAFPGNKPERFKKLLEHGADPNVFVESDFNTRQFIHPGDSVTQMAAKSAFEEYFTLVMDHGGDPNLTNPQTKQTLLETVISRGKDAKARVKLLADKGADLNRRGSTGAPPVIDALSSFAQYDLVLLLLESGADPSAYIERYNTKLVHYVVRDQARLSRITPQQRHDLEKLVEVLKAKGESFEEAEADWKRWEPWKSLPLKEQGRLRQAETAARQAKQAAAKQSDASSSK